MDQHSLWKESLGVVTRTMFSKRFARTGAAVFSATRRQNSSAVGNFLMNNVWLKSTPLYLTYIFVGAIAVEMVYGQVTTALWETMNRGVSQQQSLIIVL